MQINQDDQVNTSVALNFKRNFIVNSLDNMVWLFGESFISISTILPVFIATLTDSPMVLGLVPALLNAGWFLPQMFMAGTVQKLPQVLPLAKKLAIFERIPYFFFPILAIAILKLPTNVALWILVLLLAWKGVAAGFVALPWQEVIARVIPISHRSRFFGASRLAGQILGVVGSALSAVIFRTVSYPYNYAISFAIALVAMWAAFYFFTLNKEPVLDTHMEQPESGILGEVKAPKASLLDIKTFKNILRADKNFRSYLVSRSFAFMGNMASGFLAVYAVKRFELADEQAAIFTGLLFLSGIIGYTIWGVLGDKIGPKRILIISWFIWMAALLVAIFAPAIWVYYAVFFLLGLSSAGGILGDIILVMELGNEEQRPAYLGLARTLPGIFLLIAPLLAGGIVSLSNSYPLMFVVSLVFSGLGIVFLIRVKDRMRSKRSNHFRPIG